MTQAHYFGLEKLSDELMLLAVDVERKKEVSCTLTHTLYCGQKNRLLLLFPLSFPFILFLLFLLSLPFRSSCLAFFKGLPTALLTGVQNMWQPGSQAARHFFFGRHFLINKFKYF